MLSKTIGNDVNDVTDDEWSEYDLGRAVLEWATQQHCVKDVQMQSFFWSVFSRIRTEYGVNRSKSPYSGQMWEVMDQKNSVFGHFSRSASLISFVINMLFLLVKVCMYIKYTVQSFPYGFG